MTTVANIALSVSTFVIKNPFATLQWGCIGYKNCFVTGLLLLWDHADRSAAYQGKQCEQGYGLLDLIIEFHLESFQLVVFDLSPRSFHRARTVRDELCSFGKTPDDIRCILRMIQDHPIPFDVQGHIIVCGRHLLSLGDIFMPEPVTMPIPHSSRQVSGGPGT